MEKRHYIIGAIIIIFEQLVKHLAINKNIAIIPNFLKITYTENFGAAFGIGAKYIVLIFSIIIIIGILFFLKNEKNKIENYWPYVLIISGAIGNLIDRVFRGYVIDYIDINIWNFPNFNIADICIVIGIFWEILHFLALYSKICKEKIEEKRQ